MRSCFLSVICPPWFVVFRVDNWHASLLFPAKVEATRKSRSPPLQLGDQARGLVDGVVHPPPAAILDDQQLGCKLGSGKDTGCHARRHVRQDARGVSGGASGI